MNPKHAKLLIIAVVLVLAGVAVKTTLTSQGASNANSGAIFTTNKTGTVVNQNLYPAKEAVFLNGGPQNGKCGAAGLANGEYYFQVTDPSGKTLLSTDGIDQRKFAVQGGVISGYLGTTHATSTGPCNGKTVGLAPFSNTSNPGGEYKVWVTAVANYSADKGNFGFQNNASKTDNFKVVAGEEPGAITVSGRVYKDMNANGTDDGEEGMPGITVQLKASGSTTVVASVASGTDGSYTLGSLAAGTYDLCEALPLTNPMLWAPTEPAPNGCVQLNLTAGQTVIQNFGNKPVSEPQPM
ncbi:MAG: SdrD B-like domain-containing protein [Patescibacteria group bacterium]|nr:SdrD B-like domain-containing protein [Patescibacteria group bacterium]